eukprot:GHVN01045017.1.p1 GENE.GHVN01045017.1~~GHVN01045017.1.p1  ORF type:complete len:171 (+),score=22.31 GHVN01045017.1:259-771(+)
MWRSFEALFGPSSLEAVVNSSSNARKDEKENGPIGRVGSGLSETQSHGAQQKPIDELTQWLTYWIVYNIFFWLIHPLLSCGGPWIPFFKEMELLFFAWLVHPEFHVINLLNASTTVSPLFHSAYSPLFQGAGYLWLRFARAHAERLVNQYTKSLAPHIQPFLKIAVSSAV